MRWRFLLALDLLNVFGFAFWGPIFTLYVVKLGASPSLAGALYGFYVFIHAISFLVFGYLDKPHRRVAMIGLGFVVQAGSAGIFILIDKPVLLIIPMALSAIAGGAIAPAWKALYTRAVKVGHEGKAWSFYDAGEAGVIATGAVLAGLMANYFGYKSIFIPLAILNVIAAILCLKLPSLGLRK
jgi:MFS family permease